MSRRRAVSVLVACLLGSAPACRPSERGSVPPSAAIPGDRDLEIVLPERWEVVESVSMPIETRGFRVGPKLARSVHLTGLDELVLRDVWADRHVATLVERTSDPRIVELSSDASRLAAAMPDGSVRLWDARDGRPIVTHEGLPTSESLWFSGDGRVLVAALGDGEVRIWDGRTGELRHRLGPFDGRRIFARPSPDGRRVAVVGENRAELWDAESGRRVAGLETSGWSIDHLRFDPTGRFVTTAHEDGAVVWQAEDGARVGLLARPRSEDAGPNDRAFVSELYWSPGGRWLAIEWIGDGTWLTVHEATTSGRRVWGQQVHRVEELSFSNDDDAFAMLSGGQLFAIDLPGGRTIASGATRGDGVLIRPTEPRVVVVERYSYDDSELEGSAVSVAGNDGAGPYRATPDGRWLVANERHREHGHTYGDPLVLDARTLERRTPRARGHMIMGARFTADGAQLVTGGHRLRVWDAETLAPRAECEHHPAIERTVEDLAVIRGGAGIAARAGRTLLLYELSGDRCTVDRAIESLVFGGGPVLSAVTPAATELLVPFDPESSWPRVMSTASPKPLHELHHMLPEHSAIAPDGRLLVVASSGRVEGHSADGRQWAFERIASSVEEGETSWLRALAYEPGGSRVLAVDEAGRVRLLEPQTGGERLLHDFDGEEIYDSEVELAFAGPDVVLVRVGNTLHALSTKGPGDPLASVSDVQTLELHPDGERIALAIWSGCGPSGHYNCRGSVAVRFVSVDGLRELSEVKVPGHGLGTLSFSPDGGSLVVTGGGAMQLLRPPARR